MPNPENPAIRSSVSDQPTHPATRVLVWAVKILITGALLYVVFSKIPTGELTQDLQKVSYLPLAIAGMLLLPNIVIQFLKWRHLVRLADQTVSNSRIFQTLMIGFAMGMISPGRVGEMGRGMFVKPKGRTLMVSMSILDKVFSLFALTILGLAGLTVMVFHYLDPGTKLKIVILLLAFLVLMFILVLMIKPHWFRNFIESSKRIFRIIPRREQILTALSSLELIRRRDFQVVLGYGLIFELIIFLQFYLIINAFEPIPLDRALVAVSSIMFVKSLLPIAVMDLGVREGASIYFLAVFQIPTSSAFSASIFLFLLNVALPSLLGLYYFIVYKFRQP